MVGPDYCPSEMRESRTQWHRDTSGKMVLASTIHGGQGIGNPTRSLGEAWSGASRPEASGHACGLQGWEGRVCVCVCVCVSVCLCVCPQGLAHPGGRAK